MSTNETPWTDPTVISYDELRAAVQAILPDALIFQGEDGIVLIDSGCVTVGTDEVMGNIGLPLDTDTETE